MSATGFGAGPLRRVGLPGEVPAPAGDGAVGAQAAGMVVARGDGFERARRRHDLRRGTQDTAGAYSEAPAGDGVVGAQAAGMVFARGDGFERARRRVELPVAGSLGVNPAGDGAVGADRAGMLVAHGEGLERARRSVVVPGPAGSPAGDGAVGADRAEMPPRGAAPDEGLESARRSVERVSAAVSPAAGAVAPRNGEPRVEAAALAGDGAVGAQAAQMAAGHGDGFERARQRVTRGWSHRGATPPAAELRKVAPAGDGAVGAHAAGMAADGFERTRRRVGLPVLVVAPAGDGVVGAQAAGMVSARGDGFERAGRGSGPSSARTGEGVVPRPCRFDCHRRLAVMCQDIGNL